MKRRLTLALAASVFVLVACKPAPAKEPADPIQPAQPAQSESADSAKRQPGSWTMVHYTLDFKGENVTGDAAAFVAAGEAAVGQKDFGGPLCLTAEKASADDLMARLQEVIQFGPEWTVTHSNLSADGMVDFAASISDPEEGRAEMTITGKLTPTTTDLVLTTNSYEPAPGKGHIYTSMKQENTRAGDCTPDQETW